MTWVGQTAQLVQARQHRHPVPQRRQRRRARRGLGATGQQPGFDFGRHLGHQPLGRSAGRVVDHELDHHRGRHRQAQYLAIAQFEPAFPIFERAGVAATGVLRSAFGQQLVCCPRSTFKQRRRRCNCTDSYGQIRIRAGSRVEWHC